MKGLYEHIALQNLIDKLDQPVEDYLIEHKDVPVEWRDYVYRENSILYNSYLYESLLYSYSLRDFLNRLSKIFTVHNSELDNNDMVLYVRLGKDFDKDNKRFKLLCNLYNVFINNENKLTQYITDVTFEQSKPKNVTSSVLKYDCLYHITNRDRVDKILKYGLQPKSHSRKTYHPERVYLLLPTKELDIYMMMQQLGGDVVLKIDMNKLKQYNQKYEFFQDPMSEGTSAVFTENIIYPQVITEINNFNEL